MHNSTAYHLYTALCVYHLKSSLRPSPFIPLYSPPPPTPPFPASHNHRIVVCIHDFFLFFSFTQSLHHPHPVPLLTAVSQLSMSLSLFCLLVLLFITFHTMPNVPDVVYTSFKKNIKINRASKSFTMFSWLLIWHQTNNQLSYSIKSSASMRHRHRSI